MYSQNDCSKTDSFIFFQFRIFNKSLSNKKLHSKNYIALPVYREFIFLQKRLVDKITVQEA